MPLEQFEPTIPARERPKTHALDRAATGIGCVCLTSMAIFCAQVFMWVAALCSTLCHLKHNVLHNSLF